MQQIEAAVKIADIKYPKKDNWRVIWVLDQSSCYTAMAEDSLDAAKMNVKSDRKQPCMRNTTWNGKEYSMVNIFLTITIVGSSPPHNILTLHFSSATWFDKMKRSFCVHHLVVTKSRHVVDAAFYLCLLYYCKSFVGYLHKPKLLLLHVGVIQYFG